MSIVKEENNRFRMDGTQGFLEVEKLPGDHVYIRYNKEKTIIPADKWAKLVEITTP